MCLLSLVIGSICCYCYTVIYIQVFICLFIKGTLETPYFRGFAESNMYLKSTIYVFQIQQICIKNPLFSLQICMLNPLNMYPKSSKYVSKIQQICIRNPPSNMYPKSTVFFYGFFSNFH